MPYDSRMDLPAAVRRALPSHAQRIFMEVYNNSKGGDAARMRAAWGAVKRKYRRTSDGAWVRKRFFERVVEAVFKSEPCVSDVHVPSASRRKKPSSKLIEALEKFGQVEFDVRPYYRDRLEFLDQKRSKMPIPYHEGFLSSVRSDQVPRMLGCLTNPEMCDEREMKIADLTAIQNRVDTEKVVEMAANPPRTGKPPVVVRHMGMNYILDGHHRVVSAWLRGDEKINVRYKNLEPKSNLMKNDDWAIKCTIGKSDEELRMVYGWASQIEDGEGNIVVDSQGDVIQLKTLMDAAHGFMKEARNAGTMHEKTRGVGTVVESLIVTPDIRKALGMPEGPVGWFIGMKVDDDEAWEGVKSGKYKAFSVGGKGFRTELT